MGEFLTSPAKIEQLGRRKYRVLSNELYRDDNDEIYLVWRGFETDNFTWINSSGYDIRCSHGHDVGCLYHQVVKVNLTERSLRLFGFIHEERGEILCRDIPIRFLEVKDITGHWINNFFYRMLKAADCPRTPKAIQILYRTGVCLNFNWFKTGKKKIDLKKLYKE
jgi:hypothetical protein